MRINRDLLRQRWLAGVTSKEIGLELGIREESVRATAQRMNLPKRTRPPTLLEIKIVREGWRKQRLARDIAAEIDRPLSFVYRWARRLELPSRK